MDGTRSIGSATRASRTPCAATTATRSTGSWASSPTGSSATAAARRASEQVRAELARVGEQVADILTEAHDAAEEIRDDGARGGAPEPRPTPTSPPSRCAPRPTSTRSETRERGRRLRAQGPRRGRRVRGADRATEADAAAAESRERRRGRGRSGSSPRRPGASATSRRSISDLEQRRDAVLGRARTARKRDRRTATQHRGASRDPSEPRGGRRASPSRRRAADNQA